MIRIGTVLTAYPTKFLSVKFYSVPTTQDVIRVGQISSVVIRVGKNFSPFQQPPTVIRVGLSFLRSNRIRAIRVGFSLKCYATIPAGRLGSSRLNQLLELAHLSHSNFYLSIFDTFFQIFRTLQNLLI